jgi:hypothetical protein
MGKSSPFTIQERFIFKTQVVFWISTIMNLLVPQKNVMRFIIQLFKLISNVQKNPYGKKILLILTKEYARIKASKIKELRLFYCV